MQNSCIHPNAKIGANVKIGPFCYIAENVEIGDGCEIGPNAIIYDYVKMGKNCKVFPGAVVGAIPVKIIVKIITNEIIEVSSFFIRPSPF